MRAVLGGQGAAAEEENPGSAGQQLTLAVRWGCSEYFEDLALICPRLGCPFT